jgi:hypothetical protein
MIEEIAIIAAGSLAVISGLLFLDIFNEEKTFA